MDEYTPIHLALITDDPKVQERLAIIRWFRKALLDAEALPALDQVRNDLWKSERVKHIDKTALDGVYWEMTKVLGG